MELLQLWGQWLNGAVDQNDLLWGTSVLWWGRIGKLMQFAAAWAIVIEIIGPVRLRRWGSSLKEAVPLRFVRSLGTDARQWGGAWLLYSIRLFKKDDRRQSELYFQMWGFPALGYSATGVAAATAALSFALNFGELPWYALAFSTVGWFFLGMGVIAPLAILALILILTSATYGVNALIIMPIAVALESPYLAKLAQVLSLAVLLIGFQFDLLAS